MIMCCKIQSFCNKTGFSVASISKTTLVPYSSQQMFDLVDDVVLYKDFLPWCSASEVISDDDAEMVARLSICKGKVSNSFTTKNRRKSGSYIEMNLVEGPFKHLNGAWRFQRIDDLACTVSLNLNYEYSNSIVKKVFGVVFGHIMNTMVNAFVKRAGEVYD